MVRSSTRWRRRRRRRLNAASSSARNPASALRISPVLNGRAGLAFAGERRMRREPCAALRERVIFRIGSGIYR